MYTIDMYGDTAAHAHFWFGFHLKARVIQLM